MPFNGSGTFVSLPPPDFPALPFTTILASMFNANLNDIFTSGLTNCLTRDGQSSPTANLPMAGFRLTGLGNGVADADSAALGQGLNLRGQVGTVDWDTRTSTGLFEATAASLAGPSANFPPTTFLGQLAVVAQGATVSQVYITANGSFVRQKLAGVWSVWVDSRPSKMNSVLNSGFQAWQVGTSLGSATGRRYLADQFYNDSVGTTYTVSRQAFPVGQTDVVPEADFFHRTVVTSVAGASNYCTLETPLESVKTMAGKTLTISFWAKTAASNPLSVSVTQNFGTGGGPSASVPTAGAKITTTTSWARYTVTLTVPNISGKTIGTNNDSYLSILFWFDAGSSFNTTTNTLGQQSGTFDLFGVKVEEGSFVTSYVFPNVEDTFGLCQRFYEISNGNMEFTQPGNSGAILQRSYMTYRVVKRANPSVSITVGIGSVSFVATTDRFFNIAYGGAGEQRNSFSWTADARL